MFTNLSERSHPTSCKLRTGFLSMIKMASVITNFLRSLHNLTIPEIIPTVLYHKTDTQFVKLIRQL